MDRVVALVRFLRAITRSGQPTVVHVRELPRGGRGEVEKMSTFAPAALRRISLRVRLLACAGEGW